MCRVLFAVLVISALTGCDRAVHNSLSNKVWLNYQKQFISDDGRMIDTGNNGISHSEGQGYAMLLAVAAGERKHFDRIWGWTRDNLQVRDDHLHAWKWDPHNAEPVVDRNNASDGDLLISWALYRAAKKWNSKSYRPASLAIARDIRRKLIVYSAQGPVLLPGEKGFTLEGYITVNPSYWIFPAMRELQDIDDAPVWQRLIESGYQLMQKNQFGQYQLPADWVVLHQSEVSLSDTLSTRFGFDAIRIPLYSCWDKTTAFDPLTSIDQFWGRPDAPAWIDLRDGKTADFSLVYGQQAIRRFLKRCLKQEATNTSKQAIEEDWPAGTDYYAATLHLLSIIAEAEAGL